MQVYDALPRLAKALPRLAKVLPRLEHNTAQHGGRMAQENQGMCSWLLGLKLPVTLLAHPALSAVAVLTMRVSDRQKCHAVSKLHQRQGRMCSRNADKLRAGLVAGFLDSSIHMDH